jgi:Fe-S-cluster-containing dehydrogenase component
VSVCPATATDYSKETGIVSQIYTRCFGCRYCMGACPYHARYFNWWDPVWPKGMEQYLSPNVSPRMRGIVEKCSFCFHRYQLARDKAFAEDRRDLEENEYQTACTQACPAGAITFGDLNNPDHKVHQLARPDVQHGYKAKNPTLSACWSAWEPTPRCIICPAASGCARRVTITWLMKIPASMSRNHPDIRPVRSICNEQGAQTLWILH